MSKFLVQHVVSYFPNVLFIYSKADEREQKARDFMRAEIRFHKAEEDLQTKDLQITDHKKKEKEMEIK